MADNITGTNFSGASVTLATKELPDSAHATTAAIVDDTGAVQDLSALLQEVCIRLADIADSVGNLMPDAAGRLRVTAEVVASHAVTLASLATVTTVTTVGTVTNQTQVGGLAANQQIIALTQMAEQALRQNVVIS